MDSEKTILRYIQELTDGINKIAHELSAETAAHKANLNTYSQNTAKAKAQEKNSANNQIQKMTASKDAAIKHYMDQISRIEHVEHQLVAVCPRSRVDFSKISPSNNNQYNEQSALATIIKISGSDFWDMVKRLILGISRKKEAGNLYLQIDSGKKYFMSKAAAENQRHNASVQQVNSNYANKCRQLDAIEQQNISRENQRHQAKLNDIQRQKAAFFRNPTIPALRAALTSTMQTLDGSSNGWHRYIPSSQIPGKLLLGEMLLPCKISSPTSLQLELLRAIPSYIEKRNGFVIPYIHSASRPIMLYCESESDTSRAADIYRHIVLRQVRFMPPKSFRAYFSDPVNRGQTLGQLIHLSKNNNGCGVCEYYLSNRKISDMMTALTNHVDNVSRKLTSAGCNDIYAYNRSNAADKLPFTTLVIHDFPLGFDSTAIEALKVVITQAERCGVSVMISHKKTDKLESQALQLMQTSQDKFVHLSVRDNGCSITYDKNCAPAMFRPVIVNISTPYLAEVNNKYNYKAPLDNRISKFFSPRNLPAQRSAVRGLDIPFAIDEQGKLLELSIGYDICSHGFISGTTGSGKTTLLHTLITSAIYHYSPEELELWLADYKVTEFAPYRCNCPKHVRYAVAADSDEISYSIIDHIQAEIKHRAFLFAQANAKDYEIYRKSHKLPKILIIIDEFHRMSQAAAEDPVYKNHLENVLRTARSHGIILLLCDQFLSGLRGLSDASRKLITARIAMRNEVSDIKETLVLPSTIEDKTLSSNIEETVSGLGGTLIYRHEVADKTSSFSNKSVYTKGRALYGSSEDRDPIINAVNQRYAAVQRPHDFFVGVDRRPFDKNDILAFESRAHFAPNSGHRFYIGSPLGMGKCFYFNLKNASGEDLLLIGNNKDMQFSMIKSMVICALRHKYRIVFLIPKTAQLYKNNREYFESVPNSEIYTSFPEICKYIGEHANIINERFFYEDFYDADTASDDVPTIVMCIDADEIYTMMNNSSYTQKQAWTVDIPPADPTPPTAEPSSRPYRTSAENLPPRKRTSHSTDTDTPQTSADNSHMRDRLKSGMAELDSLSNKINEMLRHTSTEEETAQIPEKYAASANSKITGYNATKDMGILISNGYKINMHTFIVMDNASYLNHMREIKLSGNFNHRIAMSMSVAEASAFMAQTRVIKTLNDSGDTSCATYSFNGGREQCFRPYI